MTTLYKTMHYSVRGTALNIGAIGWHVLLFELTCGHPYWIWYILFVYSYALGCTDCLEDGRAKPKEQYGKGRVEGRIWLGNDTHLTHLAKTVAGVNSVHY